MNTSGLRIGMVTHYMPPHEGGIETIAQLCFRAYQAAGFHVRWLASRVQPETPRQEDGRLRVNCWNGFERWLGIPWPVWGLDGAREVTRLVQWADVLHVHDCLMWGSLRTIARGRQLGKPVLLSQYNGVISYRSAAVRAIQGAAVALLGRPALGGVSALVCCTPAAQRLVERLGGSSLARVYSIPAAVDVDRFRPANAEERSHARRHFRLPPGSRVALFVGRLVEKKGADLLAAVCRSRPTVQFLVIGAGHVRPPSLPNVTWMPWLSEEELTQAYRAADILLVPSHSEALPLVAKEAMAAGVPVIVAEEVAGLEGLNDETVCLIAERTVSALAGALDRLWQLPGDRMVAIAAAARHYVRERYGAEAMQQRYVTLVRELATGACL